MPRFGSVLFPGHGTQAGGSEVAWKGTGFVVSMQSADEPALVVVINRQPGRDSMLEGGGQGETLERGVSLLSASLPSSTITLHLAPGH